MHNSFHPCSAAAGPPTPFKIHAMTDTTDHNLSLFHHAQALIPGLIVDGTAPKQVLKGVLKMVTPFFISRDSSGADGDIEFTDPADQGLGNGTGNTVYRLREGIERFLITDINNPGASALAQSGLPVMFDQVAAVADCQPTKLDTPT